MRKFVFISILVILSSVCTSCSSTDSNKSGKNSDNSNTSINFPNMNSSTIAPVSPTITPSTTMKAVSTIMNTTTTAYVRKTPADVLYNVKSIDEAQKIGLRVVEDQSFSIELNSWGKVRFVSAWIEIEGPFKSCYFLTDDKGSILYMFPDFYGNTWSYAHSIDAVSFNDINKDGLKDIIVIAAYMTGVGSTGTVSFPVCGIYFQKDREFIRMPSLEEEINKAGKNQNIGMVLEFLKGKEIDVVSNTTPLAILKDKIHSSLPEFTFRIFGQKKDSVLSADRIIVYKAGDKEDKIQEIVVNNARTLDARQAGTYIEDMNFDGYKDIRIQCGIPPGPNIPYYYWLWDKGSSQYVRNLELEELTSPTFNNDTKVITSVNRGSAASYNERGYKFINGKLTLIKETDRVADTDKKVWHITVRELRNNELIETQKLDEPIK